MYKILPSILQPEFPATRPGGVAGADVPDSQIMWHERWYSSTMVVMYTQGGPVRWLE